jgi:hypothetical protein
MTHTTTQHLVAQPGFNNSLKLHQRPARACCPFKLTIKVLPQHAAHCRFPAVNCHSIASRTLRTCAAQSLLLSHSQSRGRQTAGCAPAQTSRRPLQLQQPPQQQQSHTQAYSSAHMANPGMITSTPWTTDCTRHLRCPVPSRPPLQLLHEQHPGQLASLGLLPLQGAAPGAQGGLSRPAPEVPAAAPQGCV